MRIFFSLKYRELETNGKSERYLLCKKAFVSQVPYGQRSNDEVKKFVLGGGRLSKPEGYDNVRVTSFFDYTLSAFSFTRRLLGDTIEIVPFL